MSQGLVHLALKRLGYRLVPEASFSTAELIPEATEADRAILDIAGGYSMTTRESLWALMQALRHVSRAGIAGDIVECGVWKGGNLILSELVLQAEGQERQIWGYDTFSGMSEPTQLDIRARDGSAAAQSWTDRQRDGFTDWCYSPIDEVRENFRSVAQSDNLRLVKGKVEDTLSDPANVPEKIAVLRLDTDWYESTKAELEILYPRLQPGGVLIVDDYGEWAGARKAIDEHFDGQAILLNRVDCTCRLAMKPAP